ncbi:hypothetical protein FPY71_16750 [Aureimonas fodinaquatilis]|uniref:HPr kinase/phosphorylase C-terminal domain-containing protein n=1 Tax=Aureimonas fodinaquatilis TaxID=2565783 RepID=A0A5B0DQ41_9HYPH|nr:HPr kinase/phosphatase C-terminal domain-containing protein [Aureimonas fodinaquatilis]KAA0968533.1 hypothetical protein FPY71_16750 [Aureimonas fodinaquatilis]
MSTNHHATLVSVDGKGVFISGAARSGKSSLALCLMRAASREGRQAGLVSDDQVLLSVQDNQLIGQAPDVLKGLMEISGVGIVPVAPAPPTPLCLAVTLQDSSPRLPEYETVLIDNIPVRQIFLPARQAVFCAEVILMLFSSDQ